MRDHNSITEGERYFDIKDIDVPVGVGMLDISRDIPNHFVRKRCFDMTYWMLNQSVKQDQCEYRGFSHKVSSLLQASLDAGDKVCIIAAQGLMAPKLYKIIRKTVTYYKHNPNFFVMGHIMARKDRYPGLHRQMLIVNLETWQRLGSPEFLEQGFFWDRKQTYPNFELSEETLSAEYTPAWIKGDTGTQQWSVVEDGSNWIALACEHGIKVDNFDNEMRECKAFLYPYEDPDKLERAWKNLQDEELLDSIGNYTQRAWLRKLAYQEHIEKDRVYAYNTERLSGEGVRASAPVDSIFSAAAGFKTMMLLKNNGFHENTIVNYYDWCDSSLKFKQHLLETWDGVDFHKWLLEHDLEYNFSSTYRGNYEEFWKQEIQKEFGSEQEFKELWDRYSKLKHNFFVIDLVNEPEKLFYEINNQSGNIVLWTTNIWPTMMLHWNVDIDEIEQKYLNFEKLVPSDLVLYGQDYLANDLEARIRKGTVETHPKFVTKWKNL
jgi:hypothetical protein